MRFRACIPLARKKKKRRRNKFRTNKTKKITNLSQVQLKNCIFQARQRVYADHN